MWLVNSGFKSSFCVCIWMKVRFIIKKLKNVVNVGKEDVGFIE